jgi:hypothetical protein
LFLHDAIKDLFQLWFVRGPPSANERHAHRPQAPAQEGDPSQFFLGKPATTGEHASSLSNLLDQVEVRPGDVVGDDHGGLALGYLVAFDDDWGSVWLHEYVLNPLPDYACNAGGEVIRQGWEDCLERQEKGEENVGQKEPGQPWRDESDASKGA